MARPCYCHVRNDQIRSNFTWSQMLERCLNYFRSQPRLCTAISQPSLHQLRSNQAIYSNYSMSTAHLPDIVLSHQPKITISSLKDVEEWSKIGKRLRIIANKFEKSRN